MAPSIYLVRLQPETVLGFDAYVRDSESAMEALMHGGSPLWSDSTPERTLRLEKGEVLAEFWAGSSPVKVPQGLIHDWIGAVWVPGATIETTLALVQDYDNHVKVYCPDVIASKLISREGEHFRVYLRLLKKKIIAVTLDTEHDAHYLRIDASRCHCRSYSTRIVEVEHAGSPGETTLPQDAGHGFLWRLYSYWSFQQRRQGVVIECRAISLTRAIPTALKLVIRPIVRSLPKEALVNTLAATRRALAGSNA